MAAKGIIKIILLFLMLATFVFSVIYSKTASSNIAKGRQGQLQKMKIVRVRLISVVVCLVILLILLVI